MSCWIPLLPHGTVNGLYPQQVSLAHLAKRNSFFFFALDMLHVWIQDADFKDSLEILHREIQSSRRRGLYLLGFANLSG